MFPLQMFAADVLDGQVQNIPGELVSCKDGGACTFCDLLDTVYNIVRWVTGIALLIAVILLMYAGYRIVSSRGDVNMVTQGRTLIGNVAVGIFITVLAFSIVDILLKTMTGGEFGAWNDMSGSECGKSNPVYTPPELRVKNDPNNPGATIPDVSTTGTGESAPTGSGYVNDGGFIDAPAPPGSNPPPVYDFDRSGPQ